MRIENETGLVLSEERLLKCRYLFRPSKAAQTLPMLSEESHLSKTTDQFPRQLLVSIVPPCHDMAIRYFLIAPLCKFNVSSPFFLRPIPTPCQAQNCFSFYAVQCVNVHSFLLLPFYLLIKNTIESSVPDPQDFVFTYSVFGSVSCLYGSGSYTFYSGWY